MGGGEGEERARGDEGEGEGGREGRKGGREEGREGDKSGRRGRWGEASEKEREVRERWSKKEKKKIYMQEEG